MFLSINVDLVQLSPRRSFDLAKALLEIGVLKSLTTDCAFTERTLNIMSSIRFFKKIRLDQYNLHFIQSSRLHVVYPAKLLLFIAGLFKAVSFPRLCFYLLAQSLVQLTYIIVNSFRIAKCSNKNIVFCFETGAFLVIVYKLIFKKSFLVFIEQCVSPRVFQLEALEKYSTSRISFMTRAYFQVLSFIESFEYKHANLVICPSNIVYNQLIKQGIASSRLRLIPYSFEDKSKTTNFHQNTIETILRPKILFVGNDLMRKGITTLMESLKLLETYDFEVHLAGNFSIQDLKNKIDFSLSKHLIIHGKLNKEDLFHLYRKCNVFVSPSFCEGSAMTILEAASFDNLIIASLESGCNLKPFVEYLPFNAGNSNELTCHLRNFMDNPVAYSNMIIKSRTALDRFSTNTYVNLLAETFISSFP
jgi:glycosyltransferase involved in cell wall biosynthesis